MNLPEHILEVLQNEGISELRPAQQKALDAGLLSGKSELICTPTASGKTLIAEIAAMNNIQNGKAIYIVPLIALANEKYKQFKKRWGKHCKIALSIGDMDKTDSQLIDYDLIICTAEKLDSLIRHHATWLSFVNTIIIDEIHLLNDVSRGPTLEILITALKQIVPTSQLIGLSATIGNPLELASWLDAALVEDKWRPVPLKKGTLMQTELEFVEQNN